MGRPRKNHLKTKEDIARYFSVFHNVEMAKKSIDYIKKFIGLRDNAFTHDQLWFQYSAEEKNELFNYLNNH